jgi:RNA polymerase sigma factor for flagellar operon FliA
MHTETLDEIRAAIGHLPEKDRTVLSLYYYEGLTLGQIGLVLHISESRVCQIHSRAIRRIRQHLSSEREAA